jgi:hypothetical protein
MTKNTYQLPTPSDEQEYILNQFLQNKNVIVNSVAGSGKTTLMLHCCRTQHDKKICIITYNKILRHETRERVKKLKLTNRVAVHTYHSFAFKYYRNGVINDDKLQDLIDDIEEGKIGPKDGTIFDILMIDEAQDMCLNYFKLLSYFLEQNEIDNIQYMVVGDPFQTLYGFKGADPEYLTRADEKFGNSRNEWVKCGLTVSYRLTPKNTSFLNMLIGEEKIKPGNLNSPNENVEYIRCNTYGDIYKIFIEQCKIYGHKNIAVLSRSVKHKNSPLAKFDKKLCENNTPSFISRNDVSNSGKNIKKNKTYIGTFNSSKGCEYNCVLVLLDSYNNENTETCSNTVYVALSRSIYKLIILQHDRNHPYSRVLDTMDVWTEDFVTQRGEQLCVVPKIKGVSVRNIDVTELLKFMSSDVLKNIVEEFLIITEIRGPDTNTISTQTEINFVYTEEDVSNLYGIGIPLAAEYHFRKTIKIADKILEPHLFETKRELEEYKIENPNEVYWCRLISEYNKDFPIKYRENLVDAYRNVKNDLNDAKDFLFIANGITAFEDYHNIIHQITHYNWVQQNSFDYSVNFLKKIIEDDLDEEAKFSFEKSYKNNKISNYNVAGRSDLVIYKDEIVVHEFKWKITLERSDFIQLACYISFEMLNNNGKTVFGKLSNSKNKEMKMVQVSEPTRFLERLIHEYTRRHN